jgi:hypothetical protein
MSTNQPITTRLTTTTESQGISGMRIRSPLGLLAALTFLVGIPISFGWQILFGSGAGTMIHFVLAAGSLLLAFSVFDFELPRWMNWIGCAAALSLGTIFLLQALALLIPSESLNYVAYEVLGQWPEGWTPDVVILWFVAMLVFDSQGRTRIFGFVAMSIAVCSELYSHTLRYLGTLDTGTLKLLMLLPFVWLLFESTKRTNQPQDAASSMRGPPKG